MGWVGDRTRQLLEAKAGSPKDFKGTFWFSCRPKGIGGIKRTLFISQDGDLLARKDSCSHFPSPSMMTKHLEWLCIQPGVDTRAAAVDRAMA